MIVVLEYSTAILVVISNLLNFHLKFCYLNYIPSINVPKATIPVFGSQCFVLCNALYWIEMYAV